MVTKKNGGNVKNKQTNIKGKIFWKIFLSEDLMALRIQEENSVRIKDS